MNKKMPISIWILVIAMALNTTAASFLWPFNTLYINGYLGESMTLAGVALLVNSALAIVGNYIGGTLFDRLGGKTTLVIAVSLLLASSLGFLLFHATFSGYLVWLGLIGFSGGLVFPTVYAFAGLIWPEGGRRSFNAIYVAQNVGVALGTAMSGQVARINIEWIFYANFFLSVLFVVVLLFGFRYLKETTRPVVESQLETAATSLSGATMKSMWYVAIGYAVLWFVYVQWQGTIAVHSQGLGVTISQYSLLWTVNGAMIVFAQPLLNRMLRQFEDDLKRQLVIGGIIFLAAFAIVPFAGAFSMFMVAMIVMTIGEMFIWPAVPTIAAKLAPAGKAGQYQGLVNIAASVGRMVGPTMSGFVYDVFGIGAVFTMLFMLTAIALAFFIFMKDIRVPEKSS
ncbi:MDR family MFS transporter [Exiguobacterium aurantiacum]|uniref:Arabinose efflux permease n=1 Tax=Exiguobacterium aurantiacum TaxID=33987 RepID=A0A377FT55_9BACL|nr:MFS transporter [Exiguobacterium aurantiacum]STO07676.1 Arabinose efflux permease [Exiguobacterium aurantiacum]